MLICFLQPIQKSFLSSICTPTLSCFLPCLVLFRAYSCTDEYVPNKREIAECVMDLLDKNECFNDELLGELIEVGVDLTSDV